MMHTIRPNAAPGACRRMAALLMMLGAGAAFAAPATKTAKAAAPAAVPPVSAQPADIAPPMQLTVGKSTLLRSPQEISRISVGNPETADVVLLNAHEVYLLGKHTGATNVFLWSKGGRTTVVDVAVGADTAALKTRINQLMPNEKNISVDAAGDALVLSGQVSDAMKAQRAALLAEQFTGKKVVNMLSTADVPQVMLEVKVAEVSKTLIDKLGGGFSGTRNTGNFTYRLLSDFLTKSGGALTIGQGATSATLDAESTKGLVKILAEPTIMAISGQEGAFLAGGKIYIPVPQSSGTGSTTITLEEKEFGVGLKFTPTVLEEGRINLRVTPEVSELASSNSIKVNGMTNEFPVITTRRASTTVQLMDGQSFAIGGLIKNNVSQTVTALPVLGEVPVLGALFRSSDFQNDRSELLFIVTPRLVKPLDANYALPTDKYVPPSRAEFLLQGKMEGTPPAKEQAPEKTQEKVPTPAPGPTPAGATNDAGRGFELK